uniref:Enoyl-CoA hydratase/isomerase family protein n=1 Tax=Phenylobacterium glaciei TaxID=2803784 RepID=A0A974P3C6_9CAUL|nr:hypothetical protein JKL49_22645 [Phenylobacterium glaciei]
MDAFAARPAPDWLADWPEEWAGFHRELYRCPAVIVGALERFAINAGAALALACDLLVAGRAPICWWGGGHRHVRPHEPGLAAPEDQRGGGRPARPGRNPRPGGGPVAAWPGPQAGGRRGGHDRSSGPGHPAGRLSGSGSGSHQERASPSRAGRGGVFEALLATGHATAGPSRVTG